MARPSQEAAEQHYFRLLAEHYPLPAGEIAFGDKPDVVISGTKNIGIEIANLHKQDGADPTTEKVQAVFRGQVIQRAESLYQNSGGRKIDLTVDFDPNIPITNVKKLASALAEIATTIAQQNSPYTSYKAFDNAPELRFLTHNGIEYADAKWRLIQGHTVPTLAIDRVKAIAAQKVQKIPQYKACDEYWLLLIVEFWDPSQDQDIEWPKIERLGKTPFERILIYKPAFKQVTEVPQ